MFNFVCKLENQPLSEQINVSDSDASRKDLKTLTQCPSDQWAQNGRTFKVQIQTLLVLILQNHVWFILYPKTTGNHILGLFSTIHSKMNFCHLLTFKLFQTWVAFFCKAKVLPIGCLSPLTSIVWTEKKYNQLSIGTRNRFLTSILQKHFVFSRWKRFGT